MSGPSVHWGQGYRGRRIEIAMPSPPAGLSFRQIRIKCGVGSHHIFAIFLLIARNQDLRDKKCCISVLRDKTVLNTVLPC